MQQTRIIKNILLSFSFFVFLCVPSFASAEKITTYDTLYTLHPDATVSVVETINYDFETEERHGIFRTLVLENAQGDKMKLSDISVVDETGTPYIFEVSGGSTKEIKIGDPDATISGAHTYVVSYTLEHAISYYEEFDEFYFDAIGTEWYVPIESVTVSVVPPLGAAPESLQYYCYAGYYGDDTACESMTLSDDASRVVFTQSALGNGVGLSVAVGFPKGILPYVKPPVDWRAIVNSVSVVLFAGVVIWLARLLYVRRWGYMTVVTQYEAPRNASPFLVGASIDEKVQPRDITALIITLASRGVLSIKEIEKKGFLGKNDYELTIQKSVSESGLTDIERHLLKAWFGSEIEKGESILLSSLKSDTALPAKIARIKELVFQEMVTRGYYEKSPKKTKASFLSAGILTVFLGGQFGFLIGGGFALSVIGAGLLLFIASFWLSKKTALGRQFRAELLGHKKFLRMTEKERLDFHQAPERKPEEFFSYLPYAIAYGVEKKWAAQFGDISLSKPTWYESNTASFTPALFVSSFGDFSPSFGKSQSSGSSGSGGGGFSGGGGGGGGGGSW